MMTIQHGVWRARQATPTWRHVRLIGFGLILLATCGCGKSERQKREEKAAEDARWDAAVAAADADRQKEEQQLVNKEVARLNGPDAKQAAGNNSGTNAAPANPAIRPSGWAVNKGNVTKQNMDDAEAAAVESLRVASLSRVKEQQLGGWDKFLPGGRSTTPVFRNAHWNTAQTAICGEIDFEWSPPDGDKRTRTGFRKFVTGSTMPQTIPWGRKGNTVGFGVGIDLDRRYYGFGKQYDAIMAVTDCTPDLEH
jgi:hypothetical protein